MNLCKTSGISARTKSLREKFSSKRSYSELSFAAPSTSTSSLANSETSSSRAGSFRRTRSTRQHGPPPVTSSHLIGSSRSSTSHHERDESTRPSTNTSVGGIISTDDSFNSYLPEDAYCSALDINCQLDGEPRFPWQRDVAIQCDLITLPHITLDTTTCNESTNQTCNIQRLLPSTSRSASNVVGKKSSSTVFSSFINRSSNQQQQQITSPSHLSSSTSSNTSQQGLQQQQQPQTYQHVMAHPANSHLLFSCNNESVVSMDVPTIVTTGDSMSNLTCISPSPAATTKKSSAFSSLRFWKSSSPLPSDQLINSSSTSPCSVTVNYPSSPSKKRILPSSRSRTKHKSVLQRAVSFDSRGGTGYSKLISNDSIVSIDSINQVNAALAAASSDSTNTGAAAADASSSSAFAISSLANNEGTSSYSSNYTCISSHINPNSPFPCSPSNDLQATSILLGEFLSPSKSEMTIINQKSASGFTGHLYSHHNRHMTPSPLHLHSADDNANNNAFDSAPESRLQSPPRCSSTKPTTPGN